MARNMQRRSGVHHRVGCAPSARVRREKAHRGGRFVVHAAVSPPPMLRSEGNEQKKAENGADGEGNSPRSLSGEVLRDEAVNGLPHRSRLHLHKADFTVNSLVDKIERKKLNLRPAYQREYVWGRVAASRLIESLLLNVPIPTLFFHEAGDGYLEVVDGAYDAYVVSYDAMKSCVCICYADLP